VHQGGFNRPPKENGVSRYSLDGLARATGLFLPSALVALALAACATPAPRSGDPLASSPSGKHEECLFTTVVSDWSDLGRESLILYGPGRHDPYLVQLNFPSNDLTFNVAIGVLDGDHNGRICGFGFDAILIPGGMPERITIRSIQKLTKDEATKLIADAHPKRKPKAAKTPAAAPPGP